MALELSKIDFKGFIGRNVYEWPLFGRVLIFFIVCIGVFYFGYYFDFSSYSGQIYNRFQQEQDLKSQIKSILNTKEDMEELVSHYPEVVNLLNQWQGQLITSENLPDLLNRILKIGADNHLQFSQFAPGTKKEKNEYYRVPIKVVVRGDYNQIGSFISQVANMPELVAIGDFSLQKQSEEGPSSKAKPADQANTANYISAGLTLEVYFLANKK